MEQVFITRLTKARQGQDSAPEAVILATPEIAPHPRPRVAGLVRKEFLQVLRDPSSVILALFMPLFLLLLFGFGVSLDPRSVPLALVLDRPNAVSESLAGAFGHSAYFETRVLPDMQAAMKDLSAHKVLGVLRIHPISVRDLLGGDTATVQLLLNGVDANTARLAESYVHGALSQWNVNWITETENRTAPPIFLQPLVWFNRNTLSNWFLVPGLFGIIMALTGTLLSALATAREWERGSLENLFATPARPKEIVMGKLLPYTAIGFTSSCLAITIAAAVFDVPMHAPLVMIFGLMLLFLLVSVGFGIVIANRTRNQFAAAVLAILGSFMPAFLLSGFIFDIHSMPVWLSYVTFVVPARYVVSGLRTLLLVGAAQRATLWDFLPLAGFGLFSSPCPSGRPNGGPTEMLARIFAFVFKELQTLLKDPRNRAVLLVPPILQTILFGYGANFDLERIPIAIYNEDRSAVTRDLVAAFTGSPHFEFKGNVMRGAEIAPLIESARVLAVVHISRHLYARPAGR